MNEKVIQPEVAPHKKKSKTADKSSSAKRSDHKHDYEKVILESFFGFKWGYRCRICGRIDSKPTKFSMSGRDSFLKPEAVNKAGVKYRDWLTIPEMRSKFPFTRIFVYDKDVGNGYIAYKELTE